jgi:hypothetical protein
VTSLPHLSAAVDRTRLALATTVVLLIPLIGLPREDQRATLPELSYLYVADIALIALGLLSLRAIATAVARTRTLEGALWAGLYLLLLLAFGVHPSSRGLDLMVRLGAASGLYLVVAHATPRERRVIVAALGITAGIQAAVAVLQFVTGAPIGLEAWGEIAADLSINRGPPMARGTMGHEYILGALALLGAAALGGESVRNGRRGAWLAGAALAVSSVGFLYGRAIAASFALVCGSLALRAREDVRYRWVIVALLVGVIPTVLMGREGWINSFARGVSSQRVEMVAQAAEIVEDDPLFGVGPGNYLDILRSRSELHTTSDLLNVHSVPALIAAEAGVPAGVISGALLVLVGLRAVRAGPLGAALFASYFMWAVLDVLPYVTPQGIVLTAIWLGLITHAKKDPP